MHIDVFTAVRIRVTVFWITIPRSLLGWFETGRTEYEFVAFLSEWSETGTFLVAIAFEVYS
jgi:hypothetical protein